jgi:hypothetical protein
MKMRMFLGAASAALLVVSTNANAQAVSSECAVGPNVPQAAQDACQKTLDVFNYMAPELGILVLGGNSTLGQGGTLGGLGRFAAGLRVNVINGSLPQVDQVVPSTNGARSDTYNTEAHWLPMPTADLALGIFRGIPLGLTNVGGVDLLVSAAYLPEYSNDFIKVSLPEGSLKLGFGARLGILQESFTVPGVAVSYLRRNLPTVTIVGTTAATSGGTRDTLRIDTLSVRTSALRVTASKNLLFFGLAIGAGRDHYTSVGTIRSRVAPRAVFLPNGATAGPVGLKQDLTRTNVFADISLNLPLFKIIGEVGQVSGGAVSTYNKFTGTQATDSRTFGSIGIRLSL